MTGAVPAYGFDAAHAGHPASSNPHEHYSRDYFVWHETWHRAMREIFIRQKETRRAAQCEELADFYRKKAEGSAL